jgi:regulator of sirC expression with transglutaminase-like and TPR domain
LSLVTIAVGRRVGLPLAGVGLPGHFIVQLQADEPTFIDPFHGGRQVSLDQCQAMVARVTGMNMPISAVDLWPVPPGPFLQRMLNNLRGIYLKGDDFRRASRILWRLHQLNPSDVQVRRDLGVCFFRTQRFGAAIDHLGSYISAAPEAEDASSIEALFQRAKRELGRWN